MVFWWWYPTPQNVIVWLKFSISDLKYCSENISLSVWYILILIPNVASHLSNATVTDKVIYWLVFIVRCTNIQSLKCSTVTWAAQMRALVSLPENCGTNTGWSDWSWYTETPSPGLLSIYFLFDPDLFPFVLCCLLLDVPNMHDSQRFTSSFKYINIDMGLQVLLV